MRKARLKHHAKLSLPGDPDRYKYIAANKPTRLRYALILTGLPYLLRALGNVFLGSRPQKAVTTGGYTPRDLAILCLWQAALIGGLSRGIGWWAYPVLWVLPVYVFTYTADIVRVFLEHSLPGGDDVADTTMRLVTYASNRVERQFFAPMNMNFHTVHHLWPSIPYYNLPIAEARVIAWSRAGGSNGRIIWRASYVRYLLDYFVWRRSGGTASLDRPGEAT